MPAVNTSEMLLIVKHAGENGADIMNIIPLIPQADFEHLSMPSKDIIKIMRYECTPFIPQINHYRQFRAEALEVLGEKYR